jgi:acetyltransferase
MAIHPYPSHLEQQWTQPDGQIVTLRPIRPEDAEMEQAFVRMLSDESKHYRFMDTLRELTPSMLARFTQIDYDRDMALIATIREHHKTRQIGVARYVPKPDGETVEFALVVADDWHKRGIGRKLMVELIAVARKKGYRTMIGDVLAMNTRMFRLVGSLGFTTQPHPDDPTVKRVAYVLGGKQRADQSDRRSPPRTA